MQGQNARKVGTGTAGVVISDATACGFFQPKKGAFGGAQVRDGFIGYHYDMTMRLQLSRYNWNQAPLDHRSCASQLRRFHNHHQCWEEGTGPDRYRCFPASDIEPRRTVPASYLD